MINIVADSLSEHIETLNQVKQQLSRQIADCGDRLVKVLQAGGKILVCGNGGSAADSQHFAAELVGRFEHERSGMPAIALTTDSSCLTAIANDYGFNKVFSRQVEALAQPGDALLGISTSGHSENVLQAVTEAKRRGCLTIGLSGREGGALAEHTDYSIVIPVQRTARIQEAHLCILHIFCEMIEKEILNSEGED